MSSVDFSAFRASFFGLVETAQHVVITAHYSPDDDSIASVLSTYTILTTKYPTKDIRIIYTGASVDRYNIFHNFDKIEWVDDVAHHIGGTDLLIMLDVNNLKRVSLFPESLASIQTKIAIDHHASAPDVFTLSLIDPQYSSNSELICRALIDESDLVKEIAELFLLGILGDTGNFSYVRPNQSEVFVLAKKLVEVVDTSIDSFRARYGGIPKGIVPVLQEYVKNTTYVDIQGWPSMQYSFITRAFAVNLDLSDEDMSAASHIYMGQYLPRVQGYGWGFVFSPRSDGGVRMSSRSLAGSVNVRLLCEAMNIGGGHDRASGANLKSINGIPVEVDACIAQVLEYMQKSKPVVS